MRNIFWVFILMCFAVSAPPCQAQDETKRTAVFNQQLLKAIVSIEVLDAQGKGSPIGTGFLVDTPNDHIALITAKHVVYANDGNGPLLQDLAYRLNRKDGKSILIPDNIATDRVESGWFRSKDNDVACRLIIREDISDIVNIPYSMFLPTQQMEAGAPLFIIGFPLGLRSDQYATPIVRRASMARVDRDMFIVDGFVYPGNSGGPVIYEPTIRLGKGFNTPLLQGDWLVGMVIQSISYKETAISTQTRRARITFEQNSGLSFILPADKIMELLRVPEFVKDDKAL